MSRSSMSPLAYLIGWHVERGYLWPCVLLAYLVAPVAAGAVLRRLGGDRRRRPSNEAHAGARRPRRNGV